jgi:predicted phosphoribosyltransferase
MSEHLEARFRDRTDAGRQLAVALRRHVDGQPALVYGIPRGGVSVAAAVAGSLGLELGVVVVRRLQAPYQPQLTIGAVSADGVAYLNEDLAREVGATERYLRAERDRKSREARRHEREYDPRWRPAVFDQTVILVDEGLVTGATTIAAVRTLKAAGAARVIAAVPGGPQKVLARLRKEADEVVCLAEAADFVTVRRLYADFHFVDGDELQAVLDELAAGRRRRPVLPDGLGFAGRLALAAIA